MDLLLEGKVGSSQRILAVDQHQARAPQPTAFDSAGGVESSSKARKLFLADLLEAFVHCKL